MIEHILPYVTAAGVAFVFTLILTPIVREINRKLGMVDKPDPRRINLVPIPRGGGLALCLGVLLANIVVSLWFNFHYTGLVGIGVLALIIALVGILDDKFSLPPRVKLFGQLFVAFASWYFVDVGFHNVFPSIPKWLDLLCTVFWITGAINAFNLIDGLDGLASGLALIATMGMTGSMFFIGQGSTMLPYFAFMGGLLGFLRYNYHPASVFLGDCGSMYIGFIVSTLPLIGRGSTGSFLVSIGVPILAMGVPILDTSLAILRRSIRRLLMKQAPNDSTDKGEGQVMTADKDHLHHRILRSAGLNQRKAAWSLYILALVAVSFALGAMMLKSRADGLWLIAITIAAIVIFKDMAGVELYDAGKLLGTLAHSRSHKVRRRIARLTTPFYLIADVAAIVSAVVICNWILRKSFDAVMMREVYMLHIIVMLAALTAAKTYSTVWSRAMLSNYFRLVVAVFIGTIVSFAAVYYIPRYQVMSANVKGTLLITFTLTTLFLVSGRFLRAFIRDTFYAIDCSRLKARKDVSRILVYGGGLRYKAFRRELVRKSTANDRMIVGIIDDDITLRGKYIGGIEILGTLSEAPDIINAVNADCLVVACEVDDEWLKVIKGMLKNSNIKITHFGFKEKEVI